MAKRINKAQTVTSIRTVGVIAEDIVTALRDKEGASGRADACYKESASILDGITARWTEIKFNACKSPESTKAAYTAAGVTDSQGAQVVEFLAPIKKAVTEFNPEVWKAVAQGIRRWSAGYTGSKPMHPDAKAKAEQAEGGKAEGGKGGKAEPMTATTRDAVLANPQNARKLISEIIAGLTDNMGLKKKNKISTTAIQEAIELLGQADVALASMK